MGERMVKPNLKSSEEACEDINCPFHGSLSFRGRIFEGDVVADKMGKTIIVKREYVKKIPKYERYERRTSKLYAHNPPCINAQVGDHVKIAECRKLSKMKSFVVLEKEGS